MIDFDEISDYTPLDLDESDFCFGCCHYDNETGMCASYEGCIRADDRDVNNL